MCSLVVQEINDSINWQSYAKVNERKEQLLSHRKSDVGEKAGGGSITANVLYDLWARMCVCAYISFLYTIAQYYDVILFRDFILFSVIADIWSIPSASKNIIYQQFVLLDSNCAWFIA